MIVSNRVSKRPDVRAPYGKNVLNLKKETAGEAQTQQGGKDLKSIV